MIIKSQDSDTYYTQLRSCESRGGRPGLPSLISLRLVAYSRLVAVKQHSKPTQTTAFEKRVDSRGGIELRSFCLPVPLVGALITARQSRLMRTWAATLTGWSSSAMLDFTEQFN